MGYRKAKIYNDGSHYIAIPYEPSPYKRKTKPKEEQVEVIEEVKEEKKKVLEPKVNLEEIKEEIPELDKEIKKRSKPKLKMTKTELFKKLYKQTLNMTKRERKSFLIKGLAPYFSNLGSTKLFVEKRLNMERGNTIARRVRVMRKVNLNEFNYFVTFTFDDKLHTEESFRKSLKKFLANYHTRYNWKYSVVSRQGTSNAHFVFLGSFLKSRI